MTALLIDTSVLIKWFHAEGEGELAPARALRSAHVAGDLEAHILDLAIYEVGNVLTRSLRWGPSEVADQLSDLHDILGPPLVMARQWLGHAAVLADTHTLSFYDACWAAAAREIGIPLVSADRALLAARLAQSPTQTSSRLGLG